MDHDGVLFLFWLPLVSFHSLARKMTSEDFLSKDCKAVRSGQVPPLYSSLAELNGPPHRKPMAGSVSHPKPKGFTVVGFRFFRKDVNEKARQSEYPAPIARREGGVLVTCVDFFRKVIRYYEST